jgi:cyclopropane-fatty-acyl-phospholipid synthase
MDNWWECRALDQFIAKVLCANLGQVLEKEWRNTWNLLTAKFFNQQSSKRAFMVGQRHYDIGNDLYQGMLDKQMQYTCGYWKDATTLDQAQEAKLALVCRKLKLEPGMKVLELGCGFGGFAHYAATRYGVEVTGYTVSKEQVKFAEKLCKGLPVDIRLADYRTATGEYDRVLSIGLMEHVGYKNYGTYMKLTNRLLRNDGIALVHTIGCNDSRCACNSWTAKYIFPNGMLPSIAQLGKAMENQFVMEDWHNFGEDYDKTLMAWYQNFRQVWPKLKDRYSDRFYRMWEYYLLSCAGGFRSRSMHLWQIVMTKQGISAPCCRLV